MKLVCNALMCSDLKRDWMLSLRSIEIPSLDHPDYYILSNDEVRTPIRFRGPRKGWIFLGVGSPHVLHALAELSVTKDIARITFCDNNPRQLGHLLRLVRFILESGNRIDFLQRLFCGNISPDAREALDEVPEAPRGTIRGSNTGRAENQLWELEKRFWAGFKFDPNSFHLAYGRVAERREDGLYTSQDVIGEINQCVLTVVCGAKDRYRVWPFTAGYGSGFLRNEESFHRLKLVLLSTPVSFLIEDITTFAQKYLTYFRYFPVALWVSNIFAEWFVRRNPSLEILRDTLTQLGSQVAPSFPELDIYLIADERGGWKVPDALRGDSRRRRPKLSVHSRTFREVASRLKGSKCIEIVNVKSWIDQDGGKSKLPCTVYSLFKDSKRLIAERKYDTAFFHILAGHGVSRQELGEALVNARANCKRLLVLEHHRLSPDFWGRRGLFTPKEIRQFLGKEDEIVYIRGNRAWVRNFLMVYDQKDVSFF